MGRDAGDQRPTKAWRPGGVHWSPCPKDHPHAGHLCQELPPLSTAHRAVRPCLQASSNRPEVGEAQHQAQRRRFLIPPLGRIYSNLLKIIAGQLNPLLIAVVFYPPAIPSAPGLRPTTSSIAAPTTSTMRAHVRDYSCVRDVYGILRALSLMFHNLESNNVYHSVIEQIFTQVPAAAAAFLCSLTCLSNWLLAHNHRLST